MFSCSSISSGLLFCFSEPGCGGVGDVEGDFKVNKKPTDSQQVLCVEMVDQITLSRKATWRHRSQLQAVCLHTTSGTLRFQFVILPMHQQWRFEACSDHEFLFPRELGAQFSPSPCLDEFSMELV